MPRKVGWILKERKKIAIKEIDKYFAKEVPAKLFGNSVSKISFVLKYAFACAQYPLWLKGSQLLLGFPIIWSFLLNWNVFRVYRLRATLWSTLWELIGGQRSRQLSDRDWKKQKAEGSIRAGKTVGPGLIHFVCFTPIAFKCHNLPQIYHVQSVHRCVANINGYQESLLRQTFHC